MRLGRIPSAAAVVALVASLAAGAPGCGGHAGNLLGPNQPPELEIVDARAAGAGGVRVRWAARDPDGRVVSSRWTLAPLASAWQRRDVATTEASECLLPRAETRVTWPGSGTVREPDLFTVWAVDNRGAESSPARLALFGDNVAPSIVITSPVPSALLNVRTGPELCVSWVGHDPDGVFTQAPVKYKFRVFDMNDPANLAYLADPDSLRRVAVATNWAGWDSTSAETTFVHLSNLVPDKSYMIAVNGFDEAGAYDPIFDLNRNMLQFQVGVPRILGPLLRVTGASLQYDYSSGDTSLDPQRWINLEVPQGQPLEYTLLATPGFGQTVSGYRWVLDPVDFADETPRSGPADVHHWSAWDVNGTSLSLPPITDIGIKRREHFLYFEARSGFGGCNPVGSDFVSVGILHLVTVHPALGHDLLIVDDTRFEPDRTGTGGCPAFYTQVWPSAAELDTFLYARGNVTWRCTRNPTTGVLTQPGLFAGYSFDTLGTRGIVSGPRDPGGNVTATVPLSVLADYRHVIWLTDINGALSINSPDSPVTPMSALKFTSDVGKSNVLSSYAAMGGKAWLAGGAGSYASLIHFDRSNNNVGQNTVFSSALGELGPGQLMYEQAHWRSTTATVKTAVQFARAPSAEAIAANPWHHWSAYAGDTLRSPNYLKLPAILQARSPGTDPIPPTRSPSQPSLFYPSTFACEYLTQPNTVLEDVDPDPDVIDEVSVLDTLVQATGAQLLLSPAPAMTWYHGGAAQQFVFSGFAPWDFARADAITLVDFVLQDIWGLSRANVDRGAVTGDAAMTRGGPARVVTPAQRAVTGRVRGGR
jgi:hypothetical protein